MPDEPKPPYVFFEVRAEEDRQATVDAGHHVAKDVVYAIVTPAGTKDRIEREATAWLLNIEEGVKQERIPGFWLSAYTRALDDFRNSRETPEFGTPIKDWPSASPAQIKNLLDMNVRTVEDLAAANEETVMRIGMGGRALKQKAQAWLDTAADNGKVSEEIAQLRTQNESLLARDAEREEQFRKMEARLAALEPATEKAD